MFLGSLLYYYWCYPRHKLLSKVLTKYCTVRGVTWGAHNFPIAESLWEVLKNLNNVTSTFFNTVHLLSKDLRFKHGAPNILLVPTPSNLVTPLCTMHMRNKYRYRLDMNKTGGNAIYHQSCQTCNRPALKNEWKAKGKVRSTWNKLFWKWISIYSKNAISFALFVYLCQVDCPFISLALKCFQIKIIF